MPGRCPSSVTCGDALRGESNSQGLAFVLLLVKFETMPSAGRATIGSPMGILFSDISIHALRGEGDVGHRPAGCRRERISIHVLREEDDLMSGGVTHLWIISIHVLREEDDFILCGSHVCASISIHVLREEDDSARR